MTNDGRYPCTMAFPEYSGEAIAYIGSEKLEFQTEEGAFSLDYSTIHRFSLKNYHLFLDTSCGQAELSQMGFDTEGFYEELWLAYNRRSCASLFIETPLLMQAEGEYSYADAGGHAKGVAKVSLHPSCVCILPADSGARRIPLCFIRDLTLDNYTIHIALDTDEQYDLIRLGRDTKPFFETLCGFRKDTQKKWRQSHRALDADLNTRLGETADRYKLFQQISAGHPVLCGLFSPDAPDFWIAAAYNRLFSVELITNEKSATYLYRVAGDEKAFEKRLRHAMEAMGLHREVLFMEEDALRTNSLYSMAVERNAHLRFLRSCMFSRVIHTESWQKRMWESANRSE